MITEDYVSFETAKLLKEKGFDEGCRAHYGNAGSFSYEKYEVEASGCEMHNAILAPTLQMAMKWLREVHRIVITTDYANICGLGFTYVASVIKIKNNGEIDDVDVPNVCLYKDSYEEVCESAIKYCLENLI